MYIGQIAVTINRQHL